METFSFSSRAFLMRLRLCLYMCPNRALMYCIRGSCHVLHGIEIRKILMGARWTDPIGMVLAVVFKCTQVAPAPGADPMKYSWSEARSAGCRHHEHLRRFLLKERIIGKRQPRPTKTHMVAHDRMRQETQKIRLLINRSPFPEELGLRREQARKHLCQSGECERFRDEPRHAKC